MDRIGTTLDVLPSHDRIVCRRLCLTTPQLCVDDAPEPVEPQPAAVVAPVVERRQAPERASTRSPSKRRKLGLGVVLVPLRAPRLLWSLWRRMDLRIIAQVTAVVALLVALQNTEFLRDILYQVMR